MKNKIIATAILIASIILIGKSLTPLKIYNHINDGNSFVESEKYSKGREEYKKALSLRENKSIHNNILKSFYMEKNYEEVIKSPADENFLKGNSLVYIGDNSPEQSQEQYKKALEEYKLAMKKSDDINIKKNYELTLKKLQESSQQNQNNQQENKDKQKDKQNQQQNDEKNSDNQEQQKNNSNSQENNQQNKDNQSSDNEQNDNKQSSDNQQQNSNQEDKQDKENNQASSNDEKNREEEKNNASQTQDSTENSNQGKEQSQEEIRKQEVRAILQRLEGSEKQSFKNNERVMDINNNNPSNRW